MTVVVRGVSLSAMISVIISAALACMTAVCMLWDGNWGKKVLIGVIVVAITMMLLLLSALRTCPATQTTDPSLLQVAHLLNIPKNQPFTITNLLKFKKGGKDEYLKYARWAEGLMKDYGIGRSTDIHDIKFTLIGEPLKEFDEMFMVSYPSIEAAKKYGAVTEADPAMVEHRRAGLEYCKLLVSYPTRASF